MPDGSKDDTAKDNCCICHDPAEDVVVSIPPPLFKLLVEHDLFKVYDIITLSTHYSQVLWFTYLSSFRLPLASMCFVRHV